MTNKTLLALAFILLNFSTAFAQRLFNNNKVSQTINLIDRLYVEEVNLDKIMNKGIATILHELDPHSVFIPAKDVEKSNEELGMALNRTANGISQCLRILDLHRPAKVDSYRDLAHYVRQRLVPWRDAIRQQCDYVCEITGKRSNVRVHHIRGFNLLFNETIDMMEFPIYDSLSEYTQEQLDEFVDMFLEIQESYGQYICIREEVHKEFHKLYGYGNNTKEQWDDLIIKYYT
jgi:hypothetical protein